MVKLTKPHINYFEMKTDGQNEIQSIISHCNMGEGKQFHRSFLLNNILDSNNCLHKYSIHNFYPLQQALDIYECMYSIDR